MIAISVRARKSAMPPAIAAVLSALQSATVASDPFGTGDPTCADRCRRTVCRDCVTNPWAKDLSLRIVLSSTLAGVLVVPGFAKLSPTQQPLIKNLTVVKPGGFLPGQFRIGSGAAGHDLQDPKETPVTEVVPRK